MDARTNDNLEIADPSVETRNLIARWRDIVKPGMYRQNGGRWKNTTNRSFFVSKEKKIEEQLQQTILDIENGHQHQSQGFQPQESRNEQWTVDTFWEVDRPQCQQIPHEDQPGSSSQDNE